MPDIPAAPSIADYVREVHRLLDDAESLIQAAYSVLNIEGLPDAQFVPQAVKRVLPHLRTIDEWAPHNRNHAHVIPVLPQLVTFCKAELEPLTVWDWTCWTAGEAADTVAAQLSDLIWPSVFDNKEPPVVPRSRRELTQELPGIRAMIGLLRKRVEIEGARAAIRGDETINSIADARPAENAAGITPDPVAVAITMKVRNPELSLRSIAEAVKMNPSTLWRDPAWKAACERVKQHIGGQIRRGSRDDNGNIDAEDDGD